MIVGGAQENTLYNCTDLVTQYGDQVLLITGPSLGAEGQLMQHRQKVEGLSIQVIDSLRRSIGPRDLIAYKQIKQTIAQFAPDVVHTHSAKGGFLGRSAAWQCRVPVIVHTVHGAPFHQYQLRLVRSAYVQLERWAARR
jgi:UDP-N-acetylglucosamine:LPS N-acetylglucosamine transferase